MANLEDLELFVLIADLQGLSPAARAMSITPAAASMALKRLENRLGALLFTRSTRNMKLTPEGTRYLESAQLALKILANAKSSLTHDDGVLELSVPSDIGRNLLIDLLSREKMTKPRLHIKLSLSDKEEDLFKGKFDAALRFGRSRTLDLVELPVLKQHYFIACASPAYLTIHPAPDTPDQLKEHDCITNYNLGRPDAIWHFHRSGEVEEVRVWGTFCCDDSDVARRWALRGNGVAYLPLLNVTEDLISGRLIALLTGWQGETAPLNIVVSHRSQINESLRSLHSCLIEQCNARIQLYNSQFNY